mgnify:CR=1 FL=1
MPSAARPSPNTSISPRLNQLLALAAALSLGAAVSLGITRFAYGLLLPTMRTDLGWTYTLAGAMNTANALGYLLGALATPWLLKRFEPVQVLVGGSVLAARLGALVPTRVGLLLGVYYGGTGLGILLSALLVPAALLAAGQVPHGWAWAWWALAGCCVLATVVLGWVGRRLQMLTAPPASIANMPVQRLFAWRDFAPGLAGYALFGVGYIGYMTFVLALLREQGVAPNAVTGFYALLGLAVMASSGIWARLLDRFKGGQALAILNALLGCATVLPAMTAAWPLVLLSGVLFGGVFLSVVASTTALVRHNLPQQRQPAAKPVGCRYQRIYGGVCGGPNHRSVSGRMDCR